MSLGHLCLETVFSVFTIALTGGKTAFPTDFGLSFSIDHALSTLPKLWRVKRVFHEEHKVI